MCLGYVLYKIINEKDTRRKKQLTIELASGFTACQAVQQRVIYSLYARLANIELDFEAQMFKALSQFKHRALDTAVVFAIGKNADPHWRSAVHVAVLEELGVEVDGYDAAFMDKDRRVLTTKQRETAMKAFLRSFSAQEFILEFVQDINQDKGSGRAGLVRNFGLKKLCQWVSEHKKESFDPYSIYYDEKKSSEYATHQSKKFRSMVPFLSFNVARSILKMMGITT
eukprot:CAMPEP_0184481926 /NCGR_PEP_ID=MMETSP0113_2-20130426/3516_1 /TAXON_ID=91329 /ORGANISM="Norrisiella sphaerica, Strain BC52" /LENGTH=225 /DNA_ID=CAMNT_0026861377 /DNA_START=98 /DNA_END=775 /DNA_ORIENTATION=-